MEDSDFTAHGQAVERGPMFLHGDEAPFPELGAVVNQNAFEYLNDGLGPAAFPTQPHHGRTTKATDSHESVKNQRRA